MKDASNKAIYRRVLLKLSGEALQGDPLFGIDADRLSRVAEEMISVLELKVQLAVVIGGGNLIRGADLCAAGLDRVTADQMGMLTTVINGLAIRDALLQRGVSAVLMSSFAIPSIAQQYDRCLAHDFLQAGKVVLFSSGTGNPLVTTDSAASLRGVEIGADILLKATKVDGVFEDDPIKNPGAERYQHLTYSEVIEKRLRVMDLTAVLLAQEYSLPMRVFNMNRNGAMQRIMLGDAIGTLIDNGYE